MVYPISYRRPERVSRPSSAASTSGEQKQKSIHDSIRSGSSGMSHGIPDALSFDRIISGGVCPVSCSACSYSYRISPFVMCGFPWLRLLTGCSHALFATL